MLPFKYELSVVQLVSVDEASHLSKLRRNDPDAICHMAECNLLESFRISIRQYIQQTIHKELENYAQVDNCLMKMSSAKDMETFSLQVCLG